MIHSPAWLETRADELRRDFERDGYVSLPGFLEGDSLRELCRQTDRFRREVVPRMPDSAVYYEDRTDPGTLKQLQQLGRHDDFFHQLQHEGPFRRLSEILLGEAVEPQNLQYFDKPPGNNRPTPAHQDGHYFMIEPPSAITLWLALEDVAEEQGCLRYVHGSHRRGPRPHAASGTLGFSQHIVDFGTEEDQAHERRFPARTGHLLAHHAWTIHRAEGNRSVDRSRKGLGFIYYGESARVDEAKAAAYQR